MVLKVSGYGIYFFILELLVTRGEIVKASLASGGANKRQKLE
jgi:hypothetical protein